MLKALLAALLTSVFVGLARLPIFERLEAAVFDQAISLRQRLWPEAVPQDPRIVVVSLEPSSYESIPDHPVFWVSHYAEAVDRLFQGGAVAVGLDILPTYADSAAIRKFAAVATRRRGQWLLIAYLDPERGVQAPPDMLLAALGVENLALANLSLDQDGVARSQILAPVLRPAYGRQSWPFLSAELAGRLGHKAIPERVTVNPSGRAFPSHPFEAVLSMDSAELRRNFAGKVVLIGSRTKVDQDIVLTPGRSGFGVDYQAEILNTLLLDLQLQTAPQNLFFALLWALNSLLGWLALKAPRVQGSSSYRWRRPDWRTSALALLGSQMLWWGGTWVAFLRGWILPALTGSLSLLTCWAATTLWRSRQEQKLLGTLEGYVAPEILEEMLAEPKAWMASLTQRREVTVLFSDINNFSTYSEKESAETVAGWLDEHYREMAHVIFQYQGTIIRFVGDQFMVLFGAPRCHPQPAEGAVETALAIHRRLQELSQRGQPGFYEVKIGIHRGPILLAVLGDDLKHEYTAVGDDANVAARIQDLCKQLGESTLVSQDIFDRISEKADFSIIDKGECQVKGRQRLVRVYGIRARDENPVDVGGRAPQAAPASPSSD